MNVALIFYGNPPEQGGVGQNLDSLIKAFAEKKDKLFFLNPFCKENNSIQLLNKQDIKFSKTILNLINKNSLKYLILSLWKIIRDKRTIKTDKLKILLYFLIKPKVLGLTINNLYHIFPHIKRIKFDVFFGGTATADVLGLIFILSRIFNKKVICLTYGNEFLVHSRFSLRTVFFKNIDLLILGTHALKQLIMKVHHLEDKKLKIIRYGLVKKDYKIDESKAELRDEFNIPMDEIILISVGRHVSRKNFDIVIKAVKTIKDMELGFPLKYFLIGEGEETPKLIKLVKSLNLKDDVKFFGFVDQKTRNKLYKLSDIFIMPSTIERESIEGFGIVFLEANYFKLPVIGTYSGGIIEAIEENTTGIFVKENSIIDLVDKIIYLCRNKDIRERMGENGKQRVLKFFNWDNLVDEYIKAIKNLIAQ